MKSLFTAILGSCLLLSTSAFAQIKVGDPEDKARSESPDYIGEYNKGSSKILYFKKGEVVITGGKVSKISWFKKKTKITELDGLIKDPAIDRAIRRKIRKSGGPLKEKDLEALRVLEINSKTKGRTRANSLIGLEGAVYLTRLQLSDNSLTNVNALTNLTLLRDLYFHGGTGIKDQSSPITDFGWLGGLTNLNTLYLNSLQIGNLAPLTNLKNLRELTLINCGVRDANALAPLAGTLEKLVLSNNAIGNAASLTVFENVNALYLNHNQIGDVTPLGQMGGLNSLYLDGNPVRDITPLMTLPKLRRLSLMGTQLQIAADSEDRVNVNTLAARGVRVIFPPAPKPEPAPTPVAAPGTEGDSAP